MPRIPFASVAVSGLGLFVAVSVGVTLYVSGAAGVRSAQALMAEQAETMLDALERRIDALTRPVDEQARWISAAFAEGAVSLGTPAPLEAFMLGALGATPQVATLGVIDRAGHIRRWSRATRGETRADWSDRPGIVAFVREGESRRDARWRPPLWGTESRTTVLLHDTPLYRHNAYLGMLVQVVPASRLSQDLALFGSESGATPFVLLGREQVLAHPLLAAARRDAERPATPLPVIADIADPVLARFRSPDSERPFGLRALARAQAVAASVGDARYVYITREIARFGPETLTLGVHLDVSRGSAGFGLRRLMLSIGAGLAVLVIAVLAAAWVGRRLSRPVQALAGAAMAVEEGNLEAVPRLPSSAIAEFDDASRAFNRMVDGLRERDVIRRTLGRFVSKQIARRLLKGGGRLEPVLAEASVLFCDLEEFTRLTESLGPARVVEFLNAYFGAMVEVVERHGGVITQFQGDAILAVFNVPVENPEHPRNAVQAAIEMVAATEAQDFAGVRARNRVGVSTGQLVAGAVGARGRLSYTVHGTAVNMAARLEALNKGLGTRILVAAETAARCRDLALRRLADAEVRGYSEAVVLYTPEPAPAVAASL